MANAAWLGRLPMQVNGSARCHCVLERCELKLYTCDLLSETLASALQKPPQVALPLEPYRDPHPSPRRPLHRLVLP